MRAAALGLVAALAGCNQIWGNDPVSRWDAPTGEGSPEAPLPTARLELLVTTTDATGVATNAPELRAMRRGSRARSSRRSLSVRHPDKVVRVPDTPDTRA